ncbi:DNA-directed RNA polymerase I subunit RPA1 [Nasonia vitripennis]|uniref:DNA-directed RNA polymerase subunit n=1 Tax=Nasonia vitripennis TaxID=7425 RepID=A0A7M7IR41_NASVI|nr:DNA-directed RNA polymerase I subunit RPA1 [Nasonia vitripennis]XP_016838265.1 DNA-directed RNA polymerase I subunit RPA1 [Nasonia vitripennis]
MSKYQKSGFRMTVKHLDPKSLAFSVFTADDIKNLSVKKITTPDSFNVLGHPLIGGLHDPALGPLTDTSDPCRTCGCNVYKCTGHFGHIDLPMPVINPLFHKALQTLLKLACLNCFSLQIPPLAKLLLSAKLTLLQRGYFSHIEGFEQEVMSQIADSNDGQGADIEYVRDQINAGLQKVLEVTRFKKSYKIADFNTKNTNMQWHLYVDSFLKQYSAGKKCIHCHEAISKITVLKNKIMIQRVLQNADKNESQGVVHKLEQVFLMPDQTKEYMQKLWQNEEETLKVIFPCLNNLTIKNPTDVFFFEVIPVLPPIVRPVNFLDGQLIEHPQTQVYRSIIINCLTLRNIIQAIQDGDTSRLPDAGKLVYNNTRGSSAIEKLHNAWQELQANVDHLIDRDMSKTTESANCQGLKQVIEKKQGVIRMHMMGKRVNYAARSVITPDPNLNIDEIGIPEAFATKLTYPVPVTPWNVAELRQLILNGPDVHPGAVMIEGDDGFITRLTAENYVQREAIAKRLLTVTEKANKFFHGVKIVHRHLQNGDMLLLNRQPTLHKPSIMAHKARILKGEKTLRLHYANCKAYNADFDGDEMNAHFPQNELARAEGYYIANVSNQYLVPKDGTPLSGLIQDHMIAGVRLSLRGKFFEKEDYMQLVFSALSVIQGNLILLPPAIIKPIPMWSGKQVISTIIINIIPRGKALINLTAGAKIGAHEWQVTKPRPWKCGEEFKNPKTMSESEVIIRNGELLCGILDKKHYGATPFGLIHCVFELYGGTTSSRLLSAFGKVFQSYLQRIGFTLGIEDILVKQKADKKRTEIISECRKIGESIHKSILEVPEDTPMEIVTAKMEESYWSNPKFRAQVDRKYKTALDVYTNNINKTCLPAGLIKTFPENNLQLMVQSGAKGSTVNTMQISCLLGQIELEGKRPPLMISGKSLPSFPAYDPAPRAGGFIDGRFMTGIQPQEFFFHCMAGREGLIDTAVKTSRSGYLQRCLIKHMEGLMINYDATVRDSDGSLVQIYYGEDGLDILKSRFLNDEQFEFLVENRNAIADEQLLKQLKANADPQKISKLVKKIHKWEKRHGSSLVKNRTSAFTKFSAEHAKPDSSKNKIIIPACGRSKASLSLMKKWIRTDDETKNMYRSQCDRCPDPLTAKYRQDLDFGVLSEKLESLIDNYLKKKSGSFTTSIGKEELREVLCAKVMNTLCPPGEPVGLLAAQSIGEPSTQMTLNTFHFAGRGEMNVTLGIPRLREILMMASKNIKTPSMEIPFKKDLPNLTKQANKVRLKLTKCYIANVLKHIKVERKLVHQPQRQMQYTITVEYLPHRYYKNEFGVHPKDIITKTERLFFREIFRDIKKAAKSTGSIVYFNEEKRQTKNEDSKLDEDDAGAEDEPKSRGRFDLGEMHESSDEEEVADDADATTARSVSRHQENREYDDPEEEEEEPEEADNDNENENDKVNNAPAANKDDDDNFRVSMHGINRIQYEQRKLDIVNMYVHALDYDYDAEKNQWCKLKFWLPIKLTNIDMPTILRNVANKVVLWETPAIKRAFTFQNPSGETILKTDGINVVEMFKYNEILDLHRLYSNDIYGISQTYGIEAANRVIVKEVKDVFKMYGITVDTRHLSLIADYMTFEGRFQPLSRKGMEDSASPLQQMSFESSLNFLKNATLQGKNDDLTSPSSRLMLGQPCNSGTGAFSLMVDIQQQISQLHLQPLPAVS